MRIGFDPTTYNVSEDAGNVIVTVALLSGTLDQDVNVSVSAVNGGSAEGKSCYCSVQSGSTATGCHVATINAASFLLISCCKWTTCSITNVMSCCQ